MDWNINQMDQGCAIAPDIHLSDRQGLEAGSTRGFRVLFFLIVALTLRVALAEWNMDSKLASHVYCPIHLDLEHLLSLFNKS